ncbi:hypothetical protein CLW00_103210 [Mongoliibacter ruber]|uniref:Uncharacterized protein n=1 Tax=Mongoliibacter ruber TaxID=1750599 RepID=A0A2T0WQV7_9BACT|nr:hypothetical protein CLW00_103210 [Mongoliibacter ruber]
MSIVLGKVNSGREMNIEFQMMNNESRRSRQSVFVGGNLSPVRADDIIAQGFNPGL